MGCKHKYIVTGHIQAGFANGLASPSKMQFVPELGGHIEHCRGCRAIRWRSGDWVAGSRWVRYLANAPDKK